MKKQKSLRTMAKELEISPSYLSMVLSGQRKCPPELNERIKSQIAIPEVVNSSQNQLQSVPSKQRVGGSNPSRDACSFHYPVLV